MLRVGLLPWGKRCSGGTCLHPRGFGIPLGFVYTYIHLGLNRGLLVGLLGESCDEHGNERVDRRILDMITPSARAKRPSPPLSGRRGTASDRVLVRRGEPNSRSRIVHC